MTTVRQPYRQTDRRTDGGKDTIGLAIPHFVLRAAQSPADPLQIFLFNSWPLVLPFKRRFELILMTLTELKQIFKIANT